MYGENIPPISPSSKPERRTLADILERSADEPAALSVVLRAANIARSRLEIAEARAERAEEEVGIDPDTGLWTERKFNEEVVAWVNREGASPQTQIAIVFVDMNNLKAINDTQGHDAGDLAIRDLAAKLRNIADHGLRADDFRAVSRANKQGDEFILALPAREPDEVRDTYAGEGEDVSDALREKIFQLVSAGYEDNHYAAGCVVTTRGGIQENGLAWFKKEADRRMYENKELMKNGPRRRLRLRKK